MMVEIRIASTEARPRAERRRELRALRKLQHIMRPRPIEAMRDAAIRAAETILPVMRQKPRGKNYRGRIGFKDQQRVAKWREKQHG